MAIIRMLTHSQPSWAGGGPSRCVSLMYLASYQRLLGYQSSWRPGTFLVIQKQVLVHSHHSARHASKSTARLSSCNASLEIHTDPHAPHIGAVNNVDSTTKHHITYIGLCAMFFDIPSLHMASSLYRFHPLMTSNHIPTPHYASHHSQ